MKDAEAHVQDFRFYTKSKRHRSIDLRFAFLKDRSGSRVNVELRRTEIVTGNRLGSYSSRHEMMLLRRRWWQTRVCTSERLWCCLSPDAEKTGRADLGSMQVCFLAYVSFGVPFEHSGGGVERAGAQLLPELGGDVGAVDRGIALSFRVSARLIQLPSGRCETRVCSKKPRVSDTRVCSEKTTRE